MKKIKLLLLIIFLLVLVSNTHSQWQRSLNEPVPSRQVHLDFHTSEFIPEVGKKFDKKQFQQALKTGHINQLNIFAKCHHGWSYYPTKVGNMHPTLEFDLLGSEIDACHEIGVVCPIYFTVGWSHNDAITHPEWCMRQKNGAYIVPPDYNFEALPNDVKPFGWIRMCAAASGEYHKFILKNIEEICQRYKPDGFFFDIYPNGNFGCYCSECIKRMNSEHIDINNSKAVALSYALAMKQHMKELRELIAKYQPKATVFFNSATHIKNAPSFTQRLYDLNTQQELEDLPTTWGGYDKLPLEAKYHLQQGVPVLAMSGKFHKSWGEFGGFKSTNALKYEAASMISFGASCNFGDQLHPSGEMDMSTYKNIGEAYKYVEKIEKYGPGGFPVSKLGLWLSLDEKADRGLANMLLEIHYDFVIADISKLNDLELLIIPSKSRLSQSESAIINKWIENGGKLIVFSEGAMDMQRQNFIINVGAEYIQSSPFDFDYTCVSDLITKDIVTSPFLNYSPGTRTKLTTGKALAYIREPYFNRTYEHFCSHGVTPYKTENSEFPAIIKNANVIYFAHSLDRDYYENALLIDRNLVKNAIDLLYQNPILKVNNLPSCGRVSLLKQLNENRYNVHLLYAPALQRGTVQVIEDFVPISNVEIELSVSEKIKKIYIIPENKVLKFTKTNNKIKVLIPTFSMHTAVVFEYK